MLRNNKSKTWMALVLLGIAVLFAVATYCRSEIEKQTDDNRDFVLQLHNTVTASIESLFRFAQHGSDTIQREMIFFQRKPTNVRASKLHDKLRIIVDLHDWIDQVIVVRRNGKILASSDSSRIGDIGFPHFDQLTDMNNEDNAVASQLLISEFGITRGQTIFMLGQKLTDLDEEPLGFVVMNVSPGHLLSGGAMKHMPEHGHGSIRIELTNGELIAESGGHDSSHVGMLEVTPRTTRNLLIRASLKAPRFMDVMAETKVGIISATGIIVALVLIVLGLSLKRQQELRQKNQVAELENAVAERTLDLSKANKNLKLSEDNLNIAQSIAKTGSWVLELNDNSLSWSDEIYRIFGQVPQEFGATYEAFLAAVHPDDRESVKQAVETTLSKNSPYSIDHRIIRPDGTERIVHEEAKVLFDETGNPASMIGTVQDITEHTIMERALEERAKELQRSNTDLEQFAHTVSHDLQDPLNLVTGYVSLLKSEYKDDIPQKALKYLDLAEQGSMCMSLLIHDLLEYSRVTKKKNQFAQIDMNTALSKALANLKGSIEDNGAEIETASLPSIWGDEMQLMRLMQNLIGNALKYRHPDRAPCLRISAERDGAFWLFSVHDNGLGIPQQHLEKIFGMFQRIHDDDKGTGIGLALCQRIVQLHGGSIWVESTEGEGSCFMFTLLEKPT